jgi:hypothetical protein
MPVEPSRFSRDSTLSPLRSGRGFGRHPDEFRSSSLDPSYGACDLYAERDLRTEGIYPSSDHATGGKA